MKPTIQNNAPKAIAFFDLDRTLIAPNSAIIYAKYERKYGRINSLQLLRTGFWMALYHLSILDMEKAIGKTIGFYAGTNQNMMRNNVKSFFDEEIDHLLLPGAKDAIENHKKQGHKIVIITNGSCWLAEAAAAAWGFDDWIANSFRTDEQDQLDGTYHKPLVYGSGKVIKAMEWLKDYKIDLDDCWFYTDSFTDLPLLEAVGHPRVVNPDPRLKRLSKKRNWPIYYWNNSFNNKYRKKFARHHELKLGAN
ncbi:MAG: HAD-IB family hydrolase [Zetaproteobacteria bacterium]|nr:HAD-IB family hydrolase [Pseudobdellovibrionaceae bacterium]